MQIESMRIKSTTVGAHPVNPLDSQLGKNKNVWINPNVTLIKPGIKCLMNAVTPVVTTLALSLQEGIPAVCHPDSNPQGAHIPITRAECHKSKYSVQENKNSEHTC